MRFLDIRAEYSDDGANYLTHHRIRWKIASWQWVNTFLLFRDFPSLIIINLRQNAKSAQNEGCIC